MKCDRCDQPATVHLTQVIGGKMQKLHFCGDCAEAAGVGQGAAFSMSDILLGQNPAQPLTVPLSRRACPSCGWTLKKFRNQGRLGCPDCYETFSGELEDVLQSIHQSTRHRGKHPGNLTELLRRDAGKKAVEELEAKIAAAVKEEAFEQAAAYRDELAKLRKELESVQEGLS